MAQEHAELEIVLRWRRQDDRFDVSVAYDDPLDSMDRRDFVEEPICIDTNLLSGLVAEEEEYGKALSGLLFGNPKLRSFFDRAWGTTNASSSPIPLHLRLLIDPRAPQRYHSVRWESMRDPNTAVRIATQPSLYFSRYLSTIDWRPVRPPPWHRLKALLVVANPSDLANKTRVGRPTVPLHPINVKSELERAQWALKGMDVIELAAPKEATLKKVMAALNEGIDALYLVCHGGLVEGQQPRLYLENDDGLTDVVDAGLLADRISELDHPPTIAVLCSCQSAGPGDEAMTSDAGALSAAGPRLSGAGVAAVVAMQGDISMRTAEVFLPAFFEELGKRGVVDRAMAFARRAVRDRERDWWMPVLFTRLRHGRAWYQPEFGEANDQTFRAVIDNIQELICTPVIGSGVAGEGILPSRESLADSWAERWLMPIAGQNRADLAKVAQYLSVRTAPDQPRTEVRRQMRTALLKQYGERLPADVRLIKDLGALIRAVGKQRRQQMPDEDPFIALAAMRLPIYITTSWTSLLEDAITEAGGEPDVQYFDWQEKRHDEKAIDEPDPDHPLVYHLFGSIDEPSSLVVTEDDYFAWLTEWIKRVDNDDSIPDSVRIALTRRSLLFLGYRLDDWEFRVLFQSIKSFEGVRLSKAVHVGVQVSPENNVIEPEAAQDYLQKYFNEDRVNVYFGTCQAFLADLSQRMRMRGGY